MLKRQIGLAGASALLRGGSAFLFLLLGARALGAEAFGRFSYAFGVSTVLGLVVDYGFQIKALKDLSERPQQAPSLLGVILGAKALLGVLPLVLLFFTVLGLDADTWAPVSLIPLYLAYACNSFVVVLFAHAKCQGRYGPDAVQAAVDALSVVGLGVTALLLRPSEAWLSWALLVQKAAMLPLALLLAGLPRPARPSLGAIASELAAGWPYAAHAIVGALYLNVDTFVLRALVDDREFGVYQVGLRIVTGAGMVLTVVNSVFAPRFTRGLASAPAQVRSELWRAVRGVLAGGAPAVLLAFLIGEPLLLSLFGPSFEGVGAIAWPLCAVIVLRIVGAFHGIVLTVSGRQLARVVLGVSALISIAVLDLVLVPSWGIRAAAWVLLAVHAGIGVIYAVLAENELLRLGERPL